MEKLLKGAKAGQRYLMNVLVLSDEKKKNEPQVLEVGTGIFEDIIEIIGEYDDITQLVGGTDLNVTREGTGQFDTKYTVMPAPKSKDVSPEIYAKVTDLDKYVAQEDDVRKLKAISAVSKAAGFIAASDSDYAASNAALEAPENERVAGAGAKGSDMNDVIDEGEIIEEDASLETVESKDTDDFDDADLDDLLADLG